MEKKTIYQHKYMKDLTCEIIEPTAKGFKVLQQEGRKKPKQAYYNDADFYSEKAFWTQIKVCHCEQPAQISKLNKCYRCNGYLS